jgi:Tfp pilus assembly protein PilV
MMHKRSGGSCCNSGENARAYRAFTLTEVMIATFLVTVALLAWIGLQSFMFRSSLKYREKQKASALAQSVMDSVIYNLEDDWDNLDLGRNMPAADAEFSYEIHPATVSPSCRRIEVVVRWVHKGQMEMEYKLITYHERAGY